MLVYRMTCVSLRLFHNNLGNLQEFLALLNITGNSVVINKLWQDKRGQALRCSGERFCRL